MKIAQKQRYFIVEGNIGAGKSTFLKILKQYLNVQIVLEPHEQWQSVGSGTDNLLDMFYKDPKRWAYTFQSYAFVSRVMNQEAHAKTNPYTVQVLERSVYSDRYCFAKNCFELGYMNALEWKLYQEWFSWLITNYVPKPSGFIYLRTDPKVSYERLKKRSRQEEAMVALEYIVRLHDKHEDWLIDDTENQMEDTPILVLECDQDFENNKAEQEKHIEKVGVFLLNNVSDGNNQSPISPLFVQNL